MELNASEALFGFAGWLTTRDEHVIFGATADAAVAADLVNEFIDTNALSEPRPGWEKRLRHPIEEKKKMVDEPKEETPNPTETPEEPKPDAEPTPEPATEPVPGEPEPAPEGE